MFKNIEEATYNEVITSRIIAVSRTMNKKAYIGSVFTTIDTKSFIFTGLFHDSNMSKVFNDKNHAIEDLSKDYDLYVFDDISEAISSLKLIL